MLKLAKFFILFRLKVVLCIKKPTREELEAALEIFELADYRVLSPELVFRSAVVREFLEEELDKIESV